MVIEMSNPLTLLTLKAEKTLCRLRSLPFWEKLSPEMAALILKEAESFMYYQSFDSTLGRGRAMQRIYTACEIYNGFQFKSISTVLAGGYSQAYRFCNSYLSTVDHHFPDAILEEGIERGGLGGIDEGGISFTYRPNEPFGKYTDAIFSTPFPTLPVTKKAARDWWTNIEEIYKRDKMKG